MNLLTGALAHPVYLDSTLQTCSHLHVTIAPKDFTLLIQVPQNVSSVQAADTETPLLQMRSTIAKIVPGDDTVKSLVCLKKTRRTMDGASLA